MFWADVTEQLKRAVTEMTAVSLHVFAAAARRHRANLSLLDPLLDKLAGSA